MQELCHRRSVPRRRRAGAKHGMTLSCGFQYLAYLISLPSFHSITFVLPVGYRIDCSPPLWPPFLGTYMLKAREEPHASDVC